MSRLHDARSAAGQRGKAGSGQFGADRPRQFVVAVVLLETCRAEDGHRRPHRIINFATIQDAANVGDETVLLGSVGLTDFNLTFRKLPVVGNLRAGHFVGPYSLERYSSTNAYYYMDHPGMPYGSKAPWA